MKYLYLFLLVSTTVFSQNYHYALDEKSGTSNADITAPSIPTNLVVSNITQTTATLSWTAATDDVGIADYRVYNNGSLLLNSTDGSVASYTLTGLTLNTTYNLVVRAVDAAGNESENSNTQTFSTVEDVASITRFIMIGASVINNSFVENTMLSLINTAYPNETVEFYNEAINGATSTAMAGYIDDIMNKYPYDANKNTYVMVHIGGNDVTRTRPYSTATEGEKTTLTNNLIYILNAIDEKGFTPVLNMISFRDYDDTTHDNEENGALPYNENIIKPLILSRNLELAYPDGTSFFQPYEVFYNDYETYLHE
ncbi:MAG: fibronectin type III domain-containing protein, partial [Flavobacteriales bacterium]